MKTSHTIRQIQERVHYWHQRGLFYLPPYLPHLGLAEALWRKLKTECLVVEYYLEQDCLCYATNCCLASIDSHSAVNFP